MKKNGYLLGLDIGISSVGWSIVDRDKNIIDGGVRLFPESGKDSNMDRRSKRGARRLLRRRNLRKNEVKNFLNENGFNEISSKNPYEIRVRGLNEKLEKDEIYTALMQISKRRGIHSFEDYDDSDDKLVETDGVSTKDALKNANIELKTKEICEIQLERLKNGRVRGAINKFETKYYKREAEIILKTQSNFHNEINDEFINKYLSYIERRRKYFTGPGQESPYSWKNQEEWMMNMMGRCTYFPDEKRIVKNSHTAQIFNLLNDLNNITVKGEKLTKEEKEKLIETLFKKNKSVSISNICKILSVDENDIKGYRIDKKEKPEFTKLETYYEISKILENEDNKDNIMSSTELIDKLAYIMTIYQEKEEKRNEISKLNLNISAETIELLANKNYTGSHSLSEKAINLVMEDMINTSENSMQLFSKLGLRPYKMDMKNKIKIPDNYVEEWILSPVARRSIKQTLLVINKVREKYGEFDEIIIEMAREKNSDEKKKFLNKLQKENEIMNKEIRKLIQNKKVEERLFEKLKLYLLQNSKCYYSFENIDFNTLLYDHKAYEIDHIIPRSISFDNSINNKVLVKSIENQKKGKRTPYQYMKSGEAKLSYEEYKSKVLAEEKNKRKISNLLNERDINKFEVRKEFINRNLVDTRYSTREVLNLLKVFFKDNDIDTKVKSVNGTLTNYIRKTWGFKKDRDENYLHHSQDATIVAMSNTIIKEAFNKTYDIIDNQIVDMTTGEVISELNDMEVLKENEFDNIFKKDKIKYSEVVNFPYKISHKIDSKPNRQLINDTLYSTRKLEKIDKKGNVTKEEYVVSKISNIYSKDSDIKVFFADETKKEKILMKKNDPKTFEILEKIFEEYKKVDSDNKIKENPFYTYYNETGHKIKKYSKKSNGPNIESLKYLKEKLGIHLNMTHKYANSNETSKGKKVILQSFKPYRIDVYENNGIYKFLRISYSNIKMKKDCYEIPLDWYLEEKFERGITEKFKFVNSYYKRDIICINDEKFLFNGIKYSQNRIEMKNLHKYIKGEKGRILVTIGKKFTKIKKYATDVLGNTYEVKNEKLKFIIKKY